MSLFNKKFNADINNELDNNGHKESTVNTTAEVDPISIDSSRQSGSEFTENVDEAQVKFGHNKVLSKVYGVKTLVIAVILITILFFVLYLLKNGRYEREKGDSPRSAAKLLSQILSEDDYESFKNTFINSDDSKLTEQYFSTLKNELLGEAIMNEYIILNKDDGRMYLIAVRKEENSKQYKIRFVKEVPTSVRQFFNDSAASEVDEDFENQLKQELNQTEEVKTSTDNTVITESSDERVNTSSKKDTSESKTVSTSK